MPRNDAKVWVRMPSEVRDALVTMAEKDRRSVNAQILVILERAAKECKDSISAEIPKAD